MGHHESDVLLCMEKDMERKKDILTDHRFLYMTEFLQRHLRKTTENSPLLVWEMNRFFILYVAKK